MAELRRVWLREMRPGPHIAEAAAKPVVFLVAGLLAAEVDLDAEADERDDDAGHGADDADGSAVAEPARRAGPHRM